MSERECWRIDGPSPSVPTTPRPSGGGVWAWPTQNRIGHRAPVRAPGAGTRCGHPEREHDAHGCNRMWSMGTQTPFAHTCGCVGYHSGSLAPTPDREPDGGGV